MSTETSQPGRPAPTRRGVLTAGLAALALAGCSTSRTTATPSAAAPGTGSLASPTGSGLLDSATAVETSATTAAKRPLKDLAGLIRGQLILPGAKGYDTLRLSENPRYDGARPLGLLRPKDAKDVATALRFAQDNDVPLAMRSGGHNYAGWSAGGAPGTGMPSSLVLDSRSLGGVSVSGTRATVGAGVALAPLYAALAAKGRGIAGGSCATVGITGLTLGGGVGVLTRAYGLTCDSLVAAQIVTADGKVRTVDARHDADLFWALRGGGGGHLGFVTSLTFETFAAPDMDTYYLEWPATQAKAVIQAWQDWAPSADKRLWSTLKVLGGKARPNGARILVAGTWIGKGAPPLDALLRHCPKPAIRSVKTKSYGQAMASYAGCSTTPSTKCHTGPGGALQREAFAATSHIAYSKLSSRQIDTLLSQVKGAARAGLREGGISIDALGGTVAATRPGDTAFVHRKALATVQYTGTVAGTDLRRAQAFVGGFRAAMAPAWGQWAYVNYADASIKNSASAYFGSNAARLASVAKTYDPHHAFTQPQGY